jgi:hypothetical protein
MKVFLFGILILPIFCFSQDLIINQTNPKNVQFVTSDIKCFWQAFDFSKTDTANMIEIFNKLYLEKGSYGLEKFNEISIKGMSNLVTAVKKYKSYYESIRPHTFQLKGMEKQMRKSFSKLLTLYPNAKFPNVYFLIGDLNAGGKPTKNALLIGTEVYSADENSNFQNINPAFQTLLKSLTISKIPEVVAHELIHYQQSYADSDRNLLGYAITEGSADFIAELITGKKINKLAHDYGSQHEKELWEEFRKDLNGYDINKWMFNQSVGGKPSDLGYYIGYKIVQSYYNISKNKRQAISDILNIKDFGAFLKESRYKDKFE